MSESTKNTTREIVLTVTPANVATLCADIRALAREGAPCIDYVADPDAAWDETAVELWRREHERLATWMVGARSAGQRLPELPPWQAIEAQRQGASPISQPARVLPTANPLARAALLAAAVAGMAACQSNGPMNVKADAGRDTNQTRDVGIGGGICAVQIDRDALASADLPRATDNASGGGSAIDGDQADTADAYSAPIGGIC
jgi:hypothetical protein